ncbi:MFS general substrate transporter [Massarina eburnea CBS 473.64]|uniref:MFS general substrate transporter n=1 Tax=Massarina eburnea CBS 473.64 TaxID=1395130 RepID=A0A6A6S0M7_9PLEO|nr:MFS general substrate transporter [Massarina eburnea CBS 473.64]
MKANDERTPLLAARGSNAGGEASQTSQQENEEASLPRWQIILLCYTSLVEPVAFFGIFPYVNKMIEESGIEESEVGFYSGLIESLFSATQMCVMVLWGKAADRFGRRPVLCFSLFGVSFMTALFGLSTSVWQMILFRCLSGVFAGTIVTVRAMLTENSSKSTQAKVFSWFAFARNMGIFVGPVIGGALESPAKRYPSTFGRIRFFNDYPYALPGFVTASVGFTAAILATLFLKETLHIHQKNKKADERPMSTWELLSYPGVRQVILIYNYALMLAFAFTAVFPVFQYTSVNIGGLGLTPGWIAVTMGMGGASQALWLILAFPRLHKRIGTVGLLRICAFVWPVFFGLDSICNLLLRYNQKVIFWILFFSNNIVGSGVAMAFTAVQLAVNDIAPSHETFGTLNALVLAVVSGLRAVIPALSTSLFATGVKYQIAGGQFFWIIAVCVAVGFIFAIRILPEKAAGRPQRQGEVGDA